MGHLTKFSGYNRSTPTLTLIGIVLLACWAGYADGGYFVSGWAPVVFVLAALGFIASIGGTFGRVESRWSALLALGLFAAYAAWTFASILWSPNRGDAWIGAGQTLLYLLAFWLAAGFLSLGGSRAWVLAATAIGHAAIAALTLLMLASHAQDLFVGSRLVGTVGYFNGEAAFLLTPIWVATYLASSRSINPILRGVALSGAVLALDVAILTQSRGAMVAMAVSLPIFFLISGQRLRAFLAVAPLAIALLATFPSLNDVYGVSQGQVPAPDEIERVLPSVWLFAGGAGLYGALWGLLDRRWRPPSSVVRAIGGIVLAGGILVLVFGVYAAGEHVGNPLTWGEQKREAFKTEDTAGQEADRYTTASSSGRYALWQVAWEDFTSHPLLGIGTRNYEATYYRLRQHYADYARQPHSLPLEVLAERGLVGGVLFFGFLVTCLGAGLRKRFGRLGAEGKAQVGALIAAVAYWFVHSSFEWFWQLPAVTLPAMVYLAMLVGPWERAEAAPARWPLRAVGVGAALLAVAAVAPLYAADRYLAYSSTITNPSEALAAVERAQRFDPVSPELRQREAKLAILAGDLPRAEKAYDEASRLNPGHYAPYVLLARYYQQLGKPDEALVAYGKAFALNPLDGKLKPEEAIQNEPDADPVPPYLHDLCRTPAIPAGAQNCPPDIREYN